MLISRPPSDPECSEAWATLELLPRPEDCAVLALHLPPSTAPQPPCLRATAPALVLGSM